MNAHVKGYKACWVIVDILKKRGDNDTSVCVCAEWTEERVLLMTRLRQRQGTGSRATGAAH